MEGIKDEINDVHNAIHAAFIHVFNSEFLADNGTYNFNQIHQGCRGHAAEEAGSEGR